MILGSKCDVIDGLAFLKGVSTPVPAPGAVTVIELWAKWCGPCRQIFPHLSSIYKARKDQGLVVVGISIEDDPSLDAFVRAEGDRMAYAVAVDKGGAAGRLMQRAGVGGIPHAFVVDRQGVLVYSGHPGQPEFEAKVDAALKSAVPAPDQPKALDRITATVDALRALPVKELKAILDARRITYAGLTEKSDLVDLIDKHCRSVTYYK